MSEDNYIISRLDRLEAMVLSIPEGKNYDATIAALKEDIQKIRTSAETALTRPIPSVPGDLIDSKRLVSIVRPALEDLSQQIKDLVDDRESEVRGSIKSTLGQVHSQTKAAESIAASTAQVAGDMLRARASFFARG